VRLSPWMGGGLWGAATSGRGYRGGAKGWRCGFTLIELLVVLVIIAILISVLLPAFARIRERAQSARADSECAALKNAIKAYYLEYGQWPYTGGDDTKEGEVYTATDDNWDVIRRLRVRDSDNYKDVLFLEFDNFRKVGNAIFDPWGVPYTVRIDTAYPPSTNGIPAGVEVKHSSGA